ncbi:MAG: MarC family protein [Lentisphaeria bacterium]
MSTIRFFQIFMAFYLKLVFLLTPFFILGYFLTITQGLERTEKTHLVKEITKAIIVICLAIFFGGRWIMQIFGITVDAFRAGSGVLLILTAINQVQNNDSPEKKRTISAASLFEMALVPIAVPITAGPAVLGTLMVYGMDYGFPENIPLAISIIMACVTIGVILYQADRIEKWLGRGRITILTKLTGLILSAIAVQMITIGVRNLWFNAP